MRRILWICFLLPLIFKCHAGLAQATSQTKTLVVNGKAGETTVVQINGRPYVDLETLTRIADGSLVFQGNQITLTLPVVSAGTATANSDGDHPATQAGLSRDFRIAAIETLAQMREWASTMANAIQNGYPMTESWAADHREKAATSLRQASASVSTDSDHDALALLTNEFHNMEAWSSEMIEAKKNMAAAKYSMSSDALRNEPLAQKIIQCGHFLGAMLGSGDFKDDLSCH
jgi:hypothetical protein